MPLTLQGLIHSFRPPNCYGNSGVSPLVKSELYKTRTHVRLPSLHFCRFETGSHCVTLPGLEPCRLCWPATQQISLLLPPVLGLKCAPPSLAPLDFLASPFVSFCDTSRWCQQGTKYLHNDYKATGDWRVSGGEDNHLQYKIKPKSPVLETANVLPSSSSACPCLSTLQVCQN